MFFALKFILTCVNVLLGIYRAFVFLCFYFLFEVDLVVQTVKRSKTLTQLNNICLIIQVPQPHISTYISVLLILLFILLTCLHPHFSSHNCFCGNTERSQTSLYTWCSLPQTNFINLSFAPQRQTSFMSLPVFLQHSLSRRMVHYTNLFPGLELEEPCRH